MAVVVRWRREGCQPGGEEKEECVGVAVAVSGMCACEGE